MPKPSSYDLYDQMLASGIEIDYDQSDLYVEDHPKSRSILDHALSENPELKHAFLTDTETGEKWIELPDQNMLYWDGKEEDGRA